MTPRDPADALLHAFGRHLGCLHVISRKATPWHSATFSGTRFEFALCAHQSVDHLQFVRTIGDEDIPLRSGFVADVAVTGTRAEGDFIRFEIEALTIESE